MDGVFFTQFFIQFWIKPRFRWQAEDFVLIGYRICNQVGFFQLFPFFRAGTVVLLVILGGFQIFYWAVGDGLFARAGSTIATATGLGALGSLRQFEPPHTGSNFLLDEMVYQIGRKHTDKLRVLGFAAVCVVPIAFLVTGLVGDSVVLSIGAVAFHFIGLVVCRWLFFAQAEHVVGLYYGAHG